MYSTYITFPADKQYHCFGRSFKKATLSYNFRNVVTVDLDPEINSNYLSNLRLNSCKLLNLKFSTAFQ